MSLNTASVGSLTCLGSSMDTTFIAGVMEIVFLGRTFPIPTGAHMNFSATQGDHQLPIAQARSTLRLDSPTMSLSLKGLMMIG